MKRSSFSLLSLSLSILSTCFCVEDKGVLPTLCQLFVFVNFLFPSCTKPGPIKKQR